MGVRSTNRFSGPGNTATPWMDGHLDNYYNSSFQDKGGGGNAAPQPQSATGGIKTVMNDKTIHTFISTGSLVCNENFSKLCEYVVIGGAGGGGAS